MAPRLLAGITGKGREGKGKVRKERSNNVLIKEEGERRERKEREGQETATAPKYKS